MSSNSIRSEGIENREVYWIDVYTIDTPAPLDIKMDVLVKAEEAPIEIPFHCLAGPGCGWRQFPSWHPGLESGGHLVLATGHIGHTGTMAVVNGVLIHPSCRLSKRSIMKSVCNNIVDGVVMNIMDVEIKNHVCYEHASFVFYTLHVELCR